MSDIKPWEVNYLSECFEVDFDTGVIIWKERPLHHFKNKHGCSIFNSKHSLKMADRICVKGYKRVRIQNKSLYSHRVIYLLFHNNLPEFIDHIDGDKLNNKISNLRPATSQQNSFNKTLKMSTSKYKGVSWSTEKGLWSVYIADKNLGIIDNGKSKQKFLGRFKEEKEAAKAYDNYSREIHGEFAWLNQEKYPEDFL